MEPIFGFIIYVIVAIVVSVIAGKRRGALIGFCYLIAMCIVSFGIVVLTSNITNGNGIIAGFMAFTSPLLGLIIALSTSTDERKAIINGESVEYKKCPFCAEAIRKEAIKCKHCGSDVQAKIQEEKKNSFRPIDMPIESFFVRSKAGFDVNEDNIRSMVEKIKITNQDIDNSMIIKKYKDDIRSIRAKLPPQIRDEFYKKYTYLINN
ncbi:DUF2545 family protein [Photorhabdus luminescens]|uniref:DUF2545 family protein n=1 Tax=Photorhabdus luminescens TaxID=29488 RepID=UPI00223ED097|nr:DUF2545 family protein [Photorhabdus luminescens]MCW7764324.1 DUF2545 family protein [Photorhabdus luminescens subsp. venezuelensis]